MDGGLTPNEPIQSGHSDRLQTQLGRINEGILSRRGNARSSWFANLEGGRGEVRARNYGYGHKLS